MTRAMIKHLGLAIVVVTALVAGRASAQCVLEFHPDADTDSFGNPDPALTVVACAPPVGFVADATDCDEANAAIFAGAAEVCNGRDDNCDNLIDNSAVNAPTFFADNDGDTFGDPNAAVFACNAPGGFVASPGDCDDANAVTARTTTAMGPSTTTPRTRARSSVTGM